MNRKETDPTPDWHAAFATAVADLPETVELPPEHTPEGSRLIEFRRVCPEKFMMRVDRSELEDPAAFDAVAEWTGHYPGPLAYGTTGTSKTFAAWSALGRLYVRQGRTFAWFPVRRLITSMQAYEEQNQAEEFFRQYSLCRVLFVDDIDKINWQFESQVALLWSFYDWIYRTKKPCITTSNQSREWWTEKMGEPFARRLFDDAQRPVRFTKKTERGMGDGRRSA